MAISQSAIETNVWDTLKTIISSDSTVSSFSTFIGGAYPDKFVRTAGGLPFVIIHKPNVSEERITLNTTKFFNITVEIECYANKAADVKTLSDAVRNALETATASDSMYNFKVDSDTEDFTIRDNIRIHVSTLGCSYQWVA